MKQLETKFKAGVVQFDVKKGQIDFNLNRVIQYLEKLASRSVCLAVLPEMFSCSFDNENLIRHSLETEKIIERLCSFAEKNKMAIVGTMPEQEKKLVYNTMVFIDVDGTVKGRYRKLHLFRLTGEHLYYTAGNKVVMIESSLGRIGLMTCYDLRFPELARALFARGAQLMVVSAQWPEPRQSHWETLVRARSIENQVFMICSNRTGKEDELSFPGMSMIVDPMGNVLTDAGKDDAFVFTDIDTTLVNRSRKRIPCMTDRRQEIYG